MEKSELKDGDQIHIELPDKRIAKGTISYDSNTKEFEANTTLEAEGNYWSSYVVKLDDKLINKLTTKNGSLFVDISDRLDLLPKN